MASILPMDELNRFSISLRERMSESITEDNEEEEEDIIDELLDLFLLSYAMGNSVTNDNLASNYQPTVDDVMKVVDAEVAGKTWRERVEDYFTKARKGEIKVRPGVTGTETDTKSGEPQAKSPHEKAPTVGKSEETGKDQINLTDAIIRIAETEMHRIANTAALDTAVFAGAKTKTWVTMLDDRVRDTHEYLEGETVGIRDDFYTFDGDHAVAPGLFSLPENNINCRCELVFS